MSEYVQRVILEKVSSIIEEEENLKRISHVFDEQAPIFAIETGWHKTPSAHKFGPAVRPYFLLHLIVKGKGVIKRNGIETTLSAGDAFLIKPEETTVYYADKDEPWEYYWISFYGAYTPTLITQTTPHLYMPYRKSGYIALKNAVDNEIVDQIGLLHTLFEVLNSIKSIDIQPKEVDAISTALHYLERNYFREIDIASLAKNLGFSRAYFSTIFAQKIGESPYHYLTKLRIARAKEYLALPHQTIEEIAYSVGFSSIERFSQLFKKYVGVSPLQYRKSLL